MPHSSLPLKLTSTAAHQKGQTRRNGVNLGDTPLPPHRLGMPAVRRRAPPTGGAGCTGATNAFSTSLPPHHPAHLGSLGTRSSLSLSAARLPVTRPLFVARRRVGCSPTMPSRAPPPAPPTMAAAAFATAPPPLLTPLQRALFHLGGRHRGAATVARRCRRSGRAATAAGRRCGPTPVAAAASAPANLTGADAPTPFHGDAALP